MSYTPEMLTKLKESYASGVRMVRYSDGKVVEYNSMSEMATAIANIERALAVQSSGARVSHTTATYDRGM